MEPKETSIFASLNLYADQVEIIDSHEHLPAESVRTGAQVDFATLFSHYCSGDLISAGMKPEDAKTLQDPGADVERKWQLFAPYYPLIKNGSYCRAARIAMQKFYGVHDLTSLNDALEVTEKMRQENKPGIYRRILEDACHLKTVFLFNNDIFETRYFHFVDCVDHLIHLNNLEVLRTAASEMGGTFYTLQHYVDALGAFLKRKVERSVKGIKFTSAYYRSLDFNPVPTAEAERIFNKLLSAPYLISLPLEKTIDAHEVLVLQDYLTRRVLDCCAQLSLPVVFHTGLQSGNRNNPDNARPQPLWQLFYTYPQVNFLLLHGGLPWTDETAMLAKSYPNVFIDMAWMHIISPEIAVRALKTWIDMVPKNKVLGFGGDYRVPEKVYGHVTMAKENICRALSEKMMAGALTENEACSWIDHLLYSNAANFYDV
jgi:uncharacterized protein